jgi:biopolymer transport protein ExbD
MLVVIFMVFRSHHRSAYSFNVRILPSLTYDLAYRGSSPEFVIVLVDKDHNVSINARPILPETLKENLQRAFAERPIDRKQVLVKASGRLPFGAIAKLIDELKGAGASGVTLQIDYLDKP